MLGSFPLNAYYSLRCALPRLRTLSPYQHLCVIEDSVFILQTLPQAPVFTKILPCRRILVYMPVS